MPCRARSLIVVVAVCRSPHRFELVLRDPQVIGMRRTAQVLMGRALQLLGDGRDVKAALWSALAALAAESNVISLAQLQKADSQTTAAIISVCTIDLPIVTNQILVKSLYYPLSGIKLNIVFSKFALVSSKSIPVLIN